MSTQSAKLLVTVGRDFACVKISGRANFTFSFDFKTLLAELVQKGYEHFIIDLSECMLMDSTFLGVLAEYGLKIPVQDGIPQRGIELLNPNPRITELLNNLGVLHLFKVLSGALTLPDDVQVCAPEASKPTHEQITRISLEAHKTLMAVHPDNVVRFKDVTQFLTEDLKKLEKNP